jgi:hypothetical protein
VPSQRGVWNYNGMVINRRNPEKKIALVELPPPGIELKITSLWQGLQSKTIKEYIFF